jgi:phosphate transport system permease protein
MSVVLERPASGLGAAPGSGIRKIKNNVATVLTTAAFLLAMIPLVWLLWTVVDRGGRAIMSSTWWTHSQRGLDPKTAGGGASHAIIGTVEQVAICSIISIPIALLVAVYLVEYGRGPLARATTFMVDILSGLPSIVAALFIYTVFVTTFGIGRAGWLVSLAIVLLMVPVIVRTTEEMLKLVPNELREAAYALGVPKWKTIVKIVVPTALSGVITGIVLGVARVAGETAPLLVLVGYSQSTNRNPFNSNQGSLPGMIYDQSANLSSSYSLNAAGQRVLAHNYAADRMWGAALTLILMVMLLNLVARLIARRSTVSN